MVNNWNLWDWPVESWTPSIRLARVFKKGVRMSWTIASVLVCNINLVPCRFYNPSDIFSKLGLSRVSKIGYMFVSMNLYMYFVQIPCLVPRTSIGTSFHHVLFLYKAPDVLNFYYFNTFFIIAVMFFQYYTSLFQYVTRPVHGYLLFTMYIPGTV